MFYGISVSRQFRQFWNFKKNYKKLKLNFDEINWAIPFRLPSVHGWKQRIFLNCWFASHFHPILGLFNHSFNCWVTFSSYKGCFGVILWVMQSKVTEAIPRFISQIEIILSGFYGLFELKIDKMPFSWMS